MRSQQQQQQQQFDLYYQGTHQQLLTLLYPLGGPHAHTFQHLHQQRVTYKPKSKQLSYTYQLDNFQNIDRKKQPIIYESKLVENKSNYFYSVFDQKAEVFIWRGVGGFLQLRPKPATTTTKQQATNLTNKKPQSTTKQTTKKQSSLIHIEQQLPIQLRVIQSGSQQNTSQKQLYNASMSQTKPVWQCSKEEYYAYLSN